MTFQRELAQSLNKFSTWAMSGSLRTSIYMSVDRWNNFILPRGIKYYDFQRSNNHREVIKEKLEHRPIKIKT